MEKKTAGNVIPPPCQQDPNQLSWEEARRSGLEIVSEEVEASDEPWEE